MDYNNYFAKELYKFFLQNLGRNQNSLYNLDDYLKTVPEYITSTGDGVERFDFSLAKIVSKICKKMEEDGYLIKVSQPSFFPITDSYISVDKVNAFNPEEFIRDIEYGCLDYKYQGFTFTYECLNHSVMPIVGINKKGNYDIGTAFYIGDGMYVTAAHCITGLEKFHLIDSSNQPLAIDEIWFAQDENSDIFDVAIIKATDNKGTKPLLVDDPHVLQPIMVIGYPPIPGFDAVQTVETATIGGWIMNKKSSAGEIVAPAKSYLTQLDYFIINARVKGGNSGGPVISDDGKVVGIVVQIPLDSNGGCDSGRFDIMGYGVCLPSKYFVHIIESHNTVSVRKNDDCYYSLIHES